uniref:Uncharacterized protein n=1 Tax=Aegilops tauschii subsp. strangulata TaxID=200361 RepID=A0A453PIZ5_AEGTS
ARTAGARRYKRPRSDASSSSERRLNPHPTTHEQHAATIPSHSTVRLSDLTSPSAAAATTAAALMAAAIDMYKYNTSTHQIGSAASASDQELMKALEPFITIASSSSSHYPYQYYSSPSMTQNSYMATPSSSYASSFAVSPLPTTAPASPSFSQLPPLYSSQYAASGMNGSMGLAQL